MPRLAGRELPSHAEGDGVEADKITDSAAPA
jgi:hypothetical protein